MIDSRYHNLAKIALCLTCTPTKRSDRSALRVNDFRWKEAHIGKAHRWVQLTSGPCLAIAFRMSSLNELPCNI